MQPLTQEALEPVYHSPACVVVAAVQIRLTAAGYANIPHKGKAQTHTLRLAKPMVLSLPRGEWLQPLHVHVQFPPALCTQPAADMPVELLNRLLSTVQLTVTWAAYGGDTLVCSTDDLLELGPFRHRPSVIAKDVQAYMHNSSSSSSSVSDALCSTAACSDSSAARGGTGDAVAAVSYSSTRGAAASSGSVAAGVGGSSSTVAGANAQPRTGKRRLSAAASTRALRYPELTRADWQQQQQQLRGARRKEWRLSGRRGAPRTAERPEVSVRSNDRLWRPLTQSDVTTPLPLHVSVSSLTTYKYTYIYSQCDSSTKITDVSWNVWVSVQRSVLAVGGTRCGIHSVVLQCSYSSLDTTTCC
jgi:hypothetical protein